MVSELRRKASKMASNNGKPEFVVGLVYWYSQRVYCFELKIRWVLFDFMRNRANLARRSWLKFGGKGFCAWRLSSFFCPKKSKSEWSKDFLFRIFFANSIFFSRKTLQRYQFGLLFFFQFELSWREWPKVIEERKTKKWYNQVNMFSKLI